jgi:hypothetical protein
MAMGIRKIRPLTNLKLISAGLMLFLWKFSIATEDYMSYMSALIVLPSLVEVLLEIRNFFIRHHNTRVRSMVNLQQLARHPSSGVHGEDSQL